MEEKTFLITEIIEAKGNNILLQCGNNTKHWVTNCDVQFWGYKLINELPQSFCGNTLYEGKHYLGSAELIRGHKLRVADNAPHSDDVYEKSQEFG